jgi:hypothetical protein
MGLAPSGNGENLGKSAGAKVPVPIFHSLGEATMMLDRNIDDKKIRPAPYLSAINVSANSSAIPRHRAAIRRSEFSLPLKCILRDGLSDRSDLLFDYGCGRGDNLRYLQELGFDCQGWDPVHRPDVSRRSADAVNLGYVLNVIENLEERSQTLRDAWRLCRKLLVVAVGCGDAFGAEYGDGVS